jgi:hypothetical protein
MQHNGYASNAGCDRSRHAQSRAQQRAIPRLMVDWLLRFGAEVPDTRGCTIRYFDKRAKRRLERAYGREPVRRFEDKLSCYLVEKDGRVITTGHRQKRIRRP